MADKRGDVEQAGALIILESRNSRDISQDELNELADEMREALRDARRADVDVYAIAQEAVGVGHHWIDVIEVFLPSKDFLKDAFWTSALGFLTNFMRGRFGRKHEQDRTRVIVIRESATGEIISTKMLDSAGSELVDTVMKPERGPREPPPVPTQPPDEESSESDHGAYGE